MKEVRRLAEYVTLIEAAELEGVKYKTMAQRLSRNPDKFDTMTEKLENGGKDAVLVAVASLSKKARNAWKERAKLKELSGTISPEGEAQPEPEAPWYVEADVDWYIENYREQWYKGMELGNVIREFLQYDGANKTEYAEQYAQEHLGSGKRTLYRYVKAYNEACAWADKLQKESGVGFEFFKVLCLCRKPKESGTFPSIKPEVKQVIKNIWFNEDFAANLGTREMLYEKLTLVANVNKWEKIPSYQTVTRYITYLMEDEGMKNAHFLASKGSREYKNKVMVKGSRDTSGLKVMQIVMGDEHTFDCWVAYKQPNGKVIPIKPHLAAWVDMRSRAIMGDVLCKDANSDILKQSLLKMMYSEPGGIPEYLYIDNGKDYTAKTISKNGGNVEMATKSVITKIRRKKMAEASHTTGKIAKITHIALGSGGVDANRKVIEPLPENVRLKHEVIRKPYTSSTKVSETSYEYVIKLEENELIGVEISEMALIDEDGDVAAFSNFLAKGKDETEVTFTIEDNY